MVGMPETERSDPITHQGRLENIAGLSSGDNPGHMGDWADS
jgi:hypothetical protein